VRKENLNCIKASSESTRRTSQQHPQRALPSVSSLESIFTMIFSRVVATFFAIGSVGVLALPSAPVEARADITDVLAVLDTLQSSTGGILPQIGRF